MAQRSEGWARADKIGAIGLVVAIVAAIAAVLALPGAPQVLHSDKAASQADHSSGAANPTDYARDVRPRDIELLKQQSVAYGHYEEPDTPSDALTTTTANKLWVDGEQLFFQKKRVTLDSFTRQPSHDSVYLCKASFKQLEPPPSDIKEIRGRASKAYELLLAA